MDKRNTSGLSKETLKGLCKSGKSGYPMESYESRFWHYVVRSNKCWGWSATLCYGYGLMMIRGRREMAHRVSWVIHNGPVPKGLWVLHCCDNPPCTNPKHLFLGTIHDNLNDMRSKGRGYVPQTRRGGDCTLAKLTSKDVRFILALPRERGVATRIAKRLSVNASTIQKVMDRKTWKHISVGGK